MKTTHAVLLAVLSFVAVPLLLSGDLSAAPSVGDVFSTVEFPDYGIGDFFSDLFGIGSAFSNSGSALGSFTDFIMNDTFFNPDVGLSTLASVFFLVCLIIMVACILLALVSLLKYKREYVGQ